MGRIEIDVERCKGCGICTTACPRELLYLNDKINAQGHQSAVVRGGERCTGCALCAEMCPDVAITVFRQFA